MSEKVYEMYDDYYAAEAQLQELIEARNQLEESLKTAHPSKITEGRILLSEANQKIEKYRAALKSEYDAHQKACRSREEYDETTAELKESVFAAFIYIKHRHPERFKKLEAEIYADKTPEEIEEFNKEIAHLEATRLEEFTGEKKDAGAK